MVTYSVSEEKHSGYSILNVKILDEDYGPFNSPLDFRVEDGRLLKYEGTDEHVFIPEGIHTIAKRAFYGKPIVSVTIPKSVREVEEEAFLDCTALRFIKFREEDGRDLGCERIGARAFLISGQGGYPVRNIFLPRSLSAVGDEAFYPQDRFGGCRISLYPTSAMIKYCAKCRLDKGYRSETPRLPAKAELLLRVSTADALLARSKNKFVFYDEELKKHVGIPYYKECIENAKASIVSFEEMIPDYEKELSELETEMASCKGLFKVRRREVLHRQILFIRGKEQMTKKSIERCHKDIERCRMKITELQMKLEEEVIAAAELYIRQNFSRIVADYREAQARYGETEEPSINA